jgi:hypothetical protein
MALVGEELDERDEVCGAVVSLRARIERIQVWLRSKDDVERINSIGKKLVKLLDIGEDSGIGLEFQVRASFAESSVLTFHCAVQHGGQANAFKVHIYSAPQRTSWWRIFLP